LTKCTASALRVGLKSNLAARSKSLNLLATGAVPPEEYLLKQRGACFGGSARAGRVRSLPEREGRRGGFA